MFFAAACEVMHAAQTQHLRAIFSRGDMAHHFAIEQNSGAFFAQMAVGVDLHLQAAIAEDAFGDHGHHVHTSRLGSHDEGGGFVIGVGGGRANAGDEDAALLAVEGLQGLRQGLAIQTCGQGLHLAAVCLLAEEHHRV